MVDNIFGPNLEQDTLRLQNLKAQQELYDTARGVSSGATSPAGTIHDRALGVASLPVGRGPVYAASVAGQNLNKMIGGMFNPPTAGPISAEGERERSMAMLIAKLKQEGIELGQPGFYERATEIAWQLGLTDVAQNLNTKLAEQKAAAANLALEERKVKSQERTSRASVLAAETAVRKLDQDPKEERIHDFLLKHYGPAFAEDYAKVLSGGKASNEAQLIQIVEQRFGKDAANELVKAMAETKRLAVEKTRADIKLTKGQTQLLKDDFGLRTQEFEWKKLDAKTKQELNRDKLDLDEKEFGLLKKRLVLDALSYISETTKRIADAKDADRRTVVKEEELKLARAYGEARIKNLDNNYQIALKQLDNEIRKIQDDESAVAFTQVLNTRKLELQRIYNEQKLIVTRETGNIFSVIQSIKDLRDDALANRDMGANVPPSSRVGPGIDLGDAITIEDISEHARRQITRRENLAEADKNTAGEARWGW